MRSQSSGFKKKVLFFTHNRFRPGVVMTVGTHVRHNLEASQESENTYILTIIRVAE
jgi:hypothetical protein